MISKLSILFIAKGPFGFLGGTASYMFPRILAKMGFRVKVLTFTDRWTENEKVLNKQVDHNFTLSEFNEPATFKQLKIVFKSIKCHKPDIVHVFTIHRYFIFPILFRLFGQGLNTKWLIDVRSPPLDLEKQSLLKTITDPLRQIGFNVITTHEASSAHKSFKKIFRPLFITPFGVELKSVKKKTWGTFTGKKKWRFVYIGSIAKLRQLDTLLKGIKKTVQKLEGTCLNFSVDFFGTGDAVDEFIEMIDQEQLNHFVFYRGVISQEDLFQRMCHYEVGLGYVPYEQYMDAPALKVLEYMAANLIVAASDTNGIKRQLSDNINGFLFKNTPEDISDVLVKIIKQDVGRDIITNGFNTACEQSWQKVVTRFLIPVYDRLQAEKKCH